MTTPPFPPPPQGTKSAVRRVIEQIYAVYILMEDTEGTTFSNKRPTGEFVLTEEDAKAWVEEGDKMNEIEWVSYRDYERITLKKN